MSTNSQSLITLAEAKGNFFDRQVVQDALGREVATALGRVASYVHSTARRSIRMARRMRKSELSQSQRAWLHANPGSKLPFKSSEPGKPPRSRTKLLRDHIYYAYDPSTKSAVVGPTLLRNSRTKNVPQILEFGGVSTIPIVQPRDKKDKNKRRQVLEIPVKIEPRPYMRPALSIVRPRIAGEFRNLIR